MYLDFYSEMTSFETVSVKHQKLVSVLFWNSRIEINSIMITLMMMMTMIIIIIVIISITVCYC